MSKTKFGLSILMAIAMILVFSVAAMAAAPKNLTFTSTSTTITLSWAGTNGVTFNVYQDGTKIATEQSAKTLEVTGLTEGQKYLFEVSEVASGVEDTINKIKINARAGGPAYNKGLPGYVSSDTSNDNNISNANQTGIGIGTNDGSKNTQVLKSVGMVKNDGKTGTHRTHGEYQNNTNSCASCHQTHTGASKSLLFKDGVYNTCTACHDGTLGFYNVFNHSNAGTFGGTEDGNMSVHLADGSVQVKAAPGGNLAANSGTWINEFNCASCHSPHGSYSDRLLHYNPNGMGLATATEGGIGLKDAPIVNGIPTATASSAKVILVRDTASVLGLSSVDIDGKDPLTYKAIVIYELKQNSTTKVWSYEKSTNPWLYGYVHATPKNYYTRFYTKAKGDAAEFATYEIGKTKYYSNIIDYLTHEQGKDADINFTKGYVYGEATLIDSIVRGDVGRAYVVDLDLVEIAKFGDEKGVPIYKSNVETLYDGTISGAGVKMSNYCAACHTDYLAKSGSSTGTFNQAYRHTTNSDTYTCVRCHYAHGTDVTVMMDAEGHKVGDIIQDADPVTPGDQPFTINTEYMMDQNPSSALKRYTNMSVCWGCHTSSKAEQLKNTYSYGDEDGQHDPHGLDPQGSMPGDLADPNAAIFPTAP
jgi:predicted CXXCH cytochrome family protein